MGKKLNDYWIKYAMKKIFMSLAFYCILGLSKFFFNSSISSSSAFILNSLPIAILPALNISWVPLSYG